MEYNGDNSMVKKLFLILIMIFIIGVWYLSSDVITTRGKNLGKAETDYDVAKIIYDHKAENLQWKKMYVVVFDPAEKEGAKISNDYKFKILSAMKEPANYDFIIVDEVVAKKSIKDLKTSEDFKKTYKKYYNIRIMEITINKKGFFITGLYILGKEHNKGYCQYYRANPEIKPIIKRIKNG